MDPIKRLALVYSDGSMGISPETEKLQDVLDQAANEDPRETDPKHFVRVAEVEVKIVIDHGAPRAKRLSAACPTCGRPHAEEAVP